MPRGEPRVRAGDGSKNVVGGRVRERREAQGWSQAQLTARLAYVTNGAWNPAVQEVTHIETGKRTVLDVEILALGMALDCAAAWLLTGKGEGTEVDKDEVSHTFVTEAAGRPFLPGSSTGAGENPTKAQ